MSKTVFLAAGEPSGDLHASKLASEIKKIDPDLSLMGIGGANMASAGVHLFHTIDELAIIGILDVLKHFKKIKKIFTAFLEKVNKEKPDLVILVDYPGFNIRLAEAVKKRGIKVIYYISPQIWAWGKNRINKIKQSVDKIIVLFSFEAELYKKAGVPVEFVGHPLLDMAKPTSAKQDIMEKLGFGYQNKTIALLPGSRKREVLALLPAMVKASGKLYEKHKNIQFIVVRSGSLDEEIYQRYLTGLTAPYRIVVNTGSELYNYLYVSDLAIAASGTITLECAIMNVPMVIVYKVSLLNAVIMKLFMRVRSIGLVNILAGRKIVPELIQFDCTAGNIFKEADRILSEQTVEDSIKNELFEIKKSLGEEGASRRAAFSVINSL